MELQKWEGSHFAPAHSCISKEFSSSHAQREADAAGSRRGAWRQIGKADVNTTEPPPTKISRAIFKGWRAAPKGARAVGMGRGRGKPILSPLVVSKEKYKISLFLLSRANSSSGI